METGEQSPPPRNGLFLSTDVRSCARAAEATSEVSPPSLLWESSLEHNVRSDLSSGLDLADEDMLLLPTNFRARPPRTREPILRWEE